MRDICDRFFQLQVAVFKFPSALMKDPELGIHCGGQLSHIGVMAGYVNQRICILFCFFNKSGSDFSC